MLTNCPKAQQSLMYSLALLRMPKATPRYLEYCRESFQLPDLFKNPGDHLSHSKRDSQLREYLSNPDWAAVERDLKWAANDTHHIIPYGSPDYPALLSHIETAPNMLYIKGNIGSLRVPSLSLVGSRAISSYGRAVARWFTSALSHQFAIISGLARGTDSLCHQSALDEGGVTLAVLGSGLNQIYPPEHSGLAQSIQEKGVLISELPLDAKPLPYHFPWRNRIISGLSPGVLVIEAARKSGTLITARLALEQNRVIFVVPGSIFNQNFNGSHDLIEQGAELVSHPEQIMARLAELAKTEYASEPLVLQVSHESLNLSKMLG